jgi:L-Ala-D/L-Glu epimerase
MPLTFRTFALDVHKLFALTISRGTSGSTRNFFVEVSDGTHTGIGEGAPPTGLPLDFCETSPQQLVPFFELAQTKEPFDVWQAGYEAGVEAVALAALDCALWDLKAKQVGKPLYQILGIPKPTSITTVTIGIEPREVVQERVPYILNLTGAKALKVKLGSPAGRDHDKEIWSTAREVSAEFNVALRADANGGWTPDESVEMANWLKSHDCEFIEQPLVKGDEHYLIDIFPHFALPLFLDESIRNSADVDKFADRCNGVNLKLMKSGGISDGIKVLERARHHGLGTMIGSMCETEVGIAQSAALSGWCDYVDLDTHFNHNPEPGAGTEFIDGVVTPRDVPGHGGYIQEEFLPDTHQKS